MLCPVMLLFRIQQKHADIFSHIQLVWLSYGETSNCHSSPGMGNLIERATKMLFISHYLRARL